MSPFITLPHTADIRLLVTGETIEEIFRSALLGMGNIQRNGFCEQEQGLYSRLEKIQVKSTDRTSLLIDFLSEVLTLSHINRSVYCEVVFHQLSETELSATVKGNKTRYVEEDIKAVTYHEAEIKLNKSGQLETMIVFDI